MRHRQTALVPPGAAYLRHDDLPVERRYLLETLSKMLGHKNITTTQIYAKVTHPMIDREVDMLKEKLADKFAVV